VKTLYAILGVERDTPDREVKRAFRSIARENHPDFAAQRGWNPAARKQHEARFKEAQAAYEILSDARRRVAYDKELDALRWAFMARQRERTPPRQHASQDQPPPFRGVNVEDLAHRVQTRAAQQQQLRLEASRRAYADKKSAYRRAVEEMTERLMAEVLLAQMLDLGL